MPMISYFIKTLPAVHALRVAGQLKHNVCMWKLKQVTAAAGRNIALIHLVLPTLHN